MSLPGQVRSGLGRPLRLGGHLDHDAPRVEVEGLASAAGGTAWAAPRVKPPAKPTYVALGDSYAAGVGAGSYLSDGTTCRRSLKGYPGLIASAGGYALNFQACSGATVADVAARQLGALGTTTSMVTITVGGNDIGFADTLSTCLGTNTTACLAAIAEADAEIAGVLPGRLTTLFGQVKAKVGSGTKVVVTAYPRLFNGTDCSILTSFTGDEMTRLNLGADQLAARIKTAATDAGFAYADVPPLFLGHAVCDSSPWIRNAQLTSSFESFHANASGYAYGYRPRVADALNATTTPGATMTVTTGGKTSSDTNRGTVKVKG